MTKISPTIALFYCREILAIGLLKLLNCLSVGLIMMVPFVEEVWNSVVICGKVGFLLKEKLKLLKSKLIIWNKELFGNIYL